MQVPSVPYEDEEITKRPSWVCLVRRGVCETYEAVLAVHLVEEALFISIEPANPPCVAKLLQGCDWRLWPVFAVAASADALGEEEASLAHVGTISPCLYRVD